MKDVSRVHHRGLIAKEASVRALRMPGQIVSVSADRNRRVSVPQTTHITPYEPDDSRETGNERCSQAPYFNRE